MWLSVKRAVAATPPGSFESETPVPDSIFCYSCSCTANSLSALKYLHLQDKERKGKKKDCLC